jgi:TIR domain
MKPFISYSHRDAPLLERLHAHLSTLKREGKISGWYDREIKAGGAVGKEIQEQLNACSLFLAPVSPDFLHSNYCYETEMGRALERHAAGDLTIVPLILEPCDWEPTPLGQLKALPKDGKAMTEWPNQNTAFLDVVKELRRLVDTGASHTDSRPASRPTPSPAPPTASVPNAGAKYRVQRSFDEIDRADFRSSAYRVIREYFEAQVIEVNQIPGIRARNEDIGGNGFSSLIVNQRQKGRSPAAITIRSMGSGSMYGSFMGDIYYSFQQNAPENVSNGGFRVESDEYEMFLSWTEFVSQERRRKWAPEEAAARLWADLMEKAGITSR